MGILILVAALAAMLWIMQLVAAQQKRSKLYANSRAYDAMFFLLFLGLVTLLGLSYVFMLQASFGWQLASVLTLGIAWAIAWRNPQKKHAE